MQGFNNKITTYSFNLEYKNWFHINMFKKGRSRFKWKSNTCTWKKANQIPLLKLQRLPTTVLGIEVCVMNNQCTLPLERGSIFFTCSFSTNFTRTWKCAPKVRLHQGLDQKNWNQTIILIKNGFLKLYYNDM